ncbi:aspartate dehydrogenase [Loktanella salsilacus]|uniref:aspartate dehydrogenase n=1 Tax=Loktanella salsilacus TaxID=195913 RepID=UPI0030029EF8
MQQTKLTVAIGGLGAIGKAVARALHDGIDGLSLTAVSARDAGRARDWMQDNFGTTYSVLPLGDLADHADIVVECCPAHLLGEIARPTLEAGKTLVVLSVGALLAHPDLKDLAAQTGGRILVPSGALLGLDAVQAAAQGQILSVSIETRKPPKSLTGAPGIEAMGIDLDALTDPVCCFSGTAADAISGFPANLNVAVALGLAGTGADRTEVEIWADPTVTRNTHRIRVTSDSANFEMQIEGIPSDENPRTGRLTPLSAISTLKRLVEPLVIGA